MDDKKSHIKSNVSHEFGQRQSQRIKAMVVFIVVIVLIMFGLAFFRG